MTYVVEIGSYSKFRMQDFKLERVTNLIDKSEGLFASLEFIHSHIFLCKHIVTTLTFHKKRL